MVIKAVSEQGVRLNIQKATLRDWRREFARHLREQGVAANATDRQAASLHFGTPRHSWPHFGRVRNPLIPQLSGIGWLAAKCAQECHAELVTALNLHGMTNGISLLTCIWSEPIARKSVH